MFFIYRLIDGFMNDLQKIRGSVWDMDGCVYQYPACFSDHCNEVVAKLIYEIVPKVREFGYAQLKTMAEKSYRDTGSSFSALVARYELDHDDFSAQFHQLLEVERVNAAAGLSDAFVRVVGAGHKVHLATHSHINFAKRMLPHLGLHGVFNMQVNVHTLEQFGVEHSKHLSPKMVFESIDRMQTERHETAFVEDTLANLEKIKDCDPRIKTVWIHWGRKPDAKPRAADYMFASPTQAVQAMTPL